MAKEVSNENINSTISFALAENGSGVTVVITITSYCIATHNHICTLFLKFLIKLIKFLIKIRLLYFDQQVQNYFDTCCLPPSLPDDRGRV